MRTSGVLLHLSSLPGPHGVGDLGGEAARFASFLRSAGQSWWQMCPLGPPGVSNSPYQVLSAFAGNPLFISLEELVKQRLLEKRDLTGFPSAPKKTQYADAWQFKKPRFRKAFFRFSIEGGLESAAFRAFCRRQAFWLDDYALFCAIKESAGGAPWIAWDKDLRDRRPAALAKAARLRRSTMLYHQFLQFQFFRQWIALKRACAARGIGLIGDVPIFVAHDSADVWANQNLFFLDRAGKPICVAGCPPDYFSRTGQRWGNPLYRWDALRRSGYAWWIKRFTTMFELFDAARLDHFIGFENYWRIPAAHKTAERGRWVKGPGAHFFQTVFGKLGRLNLIAEDLGAVTPAVTALRDKLGLPGMRVLQFAFSGDASNPHLPRNYVPNTVAYTGTHDNDTTVGWFRKLSPAERGRVLNYPGVKGKEIHWDMIGLAVASVANTAVVPAQDLLGLGTEARMNFPGVPLGNWEWRLPKNCLKPDLARRLAKLTELHDR